MTDISEDKKKDNRFVPRNKYVSAAIKKTVGDFCSESSYQLIDRGTSPKSTDSLYAIKPVRLSLELLQLMINTKQLGNVDYEYLNFGDFPSVSVEVNTEYSNSDQQWKKHKIYKDKGEKNCADKFCCMIFVSSAIRCLVFACNIVFLMIRRSYSLESNELSSSEDCAPRRRLFSRLRLRLPLFDRWLCERLSSSLE